MLIADIVHYLDQSVPTALQESYDNAGLIAGSPEWACTGVLCTLDVTEKVVEEAIAKKCNCIVAHHPILFRGLKSITGKHYVERVMILAIKNDIAIYAAHTNLDNMLVGVNDRIADQLKLTNRRILAAKKGGLRKLYTYVPAAQLDVVRDALFAAGAGNISRYSECSFTQEGKGTFKPGEGTQPFSGDIGKRQVEEEIKLEVILPDYIEKQVLKALFSSHPYEEVAYDVVSLENAHQETGSGLIGDIGSITETDFLKILSEKFGAFVRHTALSGKTISTVAICGGAGSFLISNVLRAKADVYVTADLKYHEFFEADGKMLLCDIGHYESEQFTTDLLIDLLLRKFPTFAVLKSEINTNPVHYFTGK